MNKSNALEAIPRNKLTLLFALGVFPLFLNGVLNFLIAPVPVLFWLFEVLIWIVVPVFALKLMLRIDDISLADFGLHKTIFKRQSLIVIVIVSILFAPLCLKSYYFFSEYSLLLITDSGFFEYQSMIPNHGIMKYLVIVYFSLTAGFVEEVFFRGILFKITHSLKNGLLIFLVLSPVLFSLIHWETGLTNMLAAFAFGLLVTIAYLIFRNIWPLIVGHTFTNLVWFSFTTGV